MIIRCYDKWIHAYPNIAADTLVLSIKELSEKTVRLVQETW